MSKELTPMMEAIEKVNSLAMDNKTINQVVLILTELLTKEKQGYEDAYEQGKIDEETIHPTYSDGQDYYNTRYNNQK